jgi:DNA-binding response OmpR family regulator
MRLLIVEDEASIRSALARGLASGGNEVHAAASLGEAREIARRVAPEALLSDLKLPDGSGLDFAGELGVPFVMMSGYASFDDAVAALRMGCVDFFTKPVAIKDLRRALERLHNRSRADTMEVIDLHHPAGPRRVQPAAASLVVLPFTAGALDWSDSPSAEARFSAADLARDQAQRQVLAELMQAAPAGRVVVNRGEGWWTAWLEAQVDWQGAHAERRSIIEDLAERCVWRHDGALVECSDG